MLLNSPGSGVIEPHVLRVVTALSRVSVPMSALQLSRVTGLDRKAVTRVLQRLGEYGLLDQRQAGAAYQYTVNRQHFLWGLFEELAGFEERLRAELAKALPAGQLGDAHASVFLFGSVARYQAKAASDIDLGIVTESEANAAAAEDAAYRVGEKVEAWTGNRVSPFVLTWSQLLLMAQGEEDPLLASWDMDAVTLAGHDMQDLILTARGDARG